jgi:hypothetical protein
MSAPSPENPNDLRMSLGGSWAAPRVVSLVNRPVPIYVHHRPNCPSRSARNMTNRPSGEMSAAASVPSQSVTGARGRDRRGSAASCARQLRGSGCDRATGPRAHRPAACPLRGRAPLPAGCARRVHQPCIAERSGAVRHARPGRGARGRSHPLLPHCSPVTSVRSSVMRRLYPLQGLALISRI